MRERGHVLDCSGFAPHAQRAALLHEAHARPFSSAEGQLRFLHFAFATDEDGARSDVEAVAGRCSEHGVEPPHGEARHFSAKFGDLGFRWERHGEFNTHTWSFSADMVIADADRWRIGGLPQPGPHLVSVDLIVSHDDLAVGPRFDAASLARAKVYGGAAIVATDFKADQDGFVRIMVSDRRLSAIERGSLAQRMLELETYRILALLGLIEAQQLQPSVSAIEKDLALLTAAITQASSTEEDERLLERLAALAARLEAGAAASLYRFGASRAYAAIVQGRLSALGEERSEGTPTLGEFLGRRLAPAMRTCTTMEERQTHLSRKLARAAQLLRTRVDVALAHQNRDLLAVMNQRTLVQQRFQALVEGLSIAAISYYVLGLVKYPLEALGAFNRAIAPPDILALLTPVVVVCVWLFLAQARRRLEGEFHR